MNATAAHFHTGMPCSVCNFGAIEPATAAGVPVGRIHYMLVDRKPSRGERMRAIRNRRNPDWTPPVGRSRWERRS